MVQKSKILGKHPLVFVTVGSTNFQFNRLFSALDPALKVIETTPHLSIQGGNSIYRSSYRCVKKNKFLDPIALTKIIKKADKIITHAGPATLFLITKHAKYMPLVIPRRKEFKEHVDDHQLFFTKFLKKKLPQKYQKYFLVDPVIDQPIKKYLAEKSQDNILKKYLFTGADLTKLTNNLKKFIESAYENSGSF